MRTLIIIAMTVCLPLVGAVACDTLKDVGRTAKDAAVILCEVFGTENPEEFERIARARMPDDQLGAAEATGFNPFELCKYADIVGPIVDQLTSVGMAEPGVGAEQCVEAE